MLASPRWRNRGPGKGSAERRRFQPVQNGKQQTIEQYRAFACGKKWQYWTNTEAQAARCMAGIFRRWEMRVRRR